jgi:hypothetical protein
MLGKDDAKLTDIGAKVAEVPVDIGVARMVGGSLICPIDIV